MGSRIVILGLLRDWVFAFDSSCHREDGCGDMLGDAFAAALVGFSFSGDSLISDDSAGYE